MVWCDAATAFVDMYDASKQGTERMRKAWVEAGLPFMPSLPTYHDGAGRKRTCNGHARREHFHRGCLRCDYRWITEDVVTG